MKPFRIVLWLVLAAGLFLGLKLLRTALTEEGGSPETAAAAEESHPNRPTEAISNVRDFSRRVVSGYSARFFFRLLARADAPLPPHRRDVVVAGPDQPAPEDRPIPASSAVASLP